MFNSFKYFFTLCCVVTVSKSRPISFQHAWSNLGSLDQGLFSNSGYNSANAEEQSDHFEGDMILSGDQWDMVNGASIEGRTGLIRTKNRWRNKIIPFVFGNEFTDNHKRAIFDGIADIQFETCLKFIPRTTQKDYIIFTGNQTGCWSYVGKQGGRQEINLQPSELDTGCFRSGTIVHEIMHALGFQHMQSATERDEYIKIIWENVRPNAKDNFRTYSRFEVSQYGIPYDYNSVMHYGPTAFSHNGKQTIVPLDPYAEIGQRYALSVGDIQRINAMYKCYEDNRLRQFFNFGFF